MKLISCIIAGSRTITDYRVVCLAMARFQATYPDLKIVTVTSGGAAGVDSLGERWAEDNHHPLNIMPAHWDVYGRKAGIMRNNEMAKINDALVAVWDGKSKGTAHMIAEAYVRKLVILIHTVSIAPQT